MLRRLSLRDFVIVSALDVEFDAGFSVLTGETGAGKSILVDALQLALGGRGDAGVVREGAARAEIVAEFDAPASLSAWLDEGGFEANDSLLLRRAIDAQGKSRAWINGSAVTIAQLRDASDHLVDIHGQHAWQSLTRGPAVRGLLDAFAGVDASPLATLWSAWKLATEALAAAGTQQAGLERERERLAWQIGEVDKLAPGADEWAELEAEHTKLANVQALIDAARLALDAISEADDNADALTGRALHALQDVASFDAQLASTIEVLQGAQAQLQDAAHTLSSYLHHTDVEPQRLQALDERLSAWVGLARRYRRPPAELAALLVQWKDELRALDAAADLEGLQRQLALALAAFETEARRVSTARRAAVPKLANAVTQAMQQLGMAGGRFDVALTKQDAPQSFGLESAEFLVAGHAGSTPRPLAKVASGGELSRIALAIAVTTSQLEGSDGAAGTLIFDEIDAGVGGAVAETVGRLMKQLGRDRQVLAVTHLPQVAACADHHFVVSKQLRGGLALSEVHSVSGELRMAEVARMLGGERLSNTRLAHAQEMLSVAAESAPFAAGEKEIMSKPVNATAGGTASAESNNVGTLREVVLVTGISGSGKSVALHALEDAGFFCVDNLPPELLRDFLRLEHERLDRRVAIAVDVRSADSLPYLLDLLRQLGNEGVSIRVVFLDASTDALVRRFSETRRPHPLSDDTAGNTQARRKSDQAIDGRRALVDAIELERELLADLREVATVIDTSQLRPAQLRVWMRDMVRAAGNRLTLVFESFAFKHGVPLDADYVFDVRVLPNPHYVRELRPLNGRDAPVADYLRAQPEVAEMLGQIEAFLSRWLPAFEGDQRSYLTVAIGCTGGQHRSVYFVETLAQRFRDLAATLVRHRELDARD